jgi:hypothetical protein
MSALVLSSGESDARKIAAAINGLAQGRSNAVGSVTLAANAAATTVSAPNCGAGSVVLLTPLTAHAAAALATTYVSSVGNGQFTLAHAASPQADRTFGFVALG